MILSVWMWSKSVRERGAETVAAQCARSGITDIFYLVKGLLGTTIYPGAYAPFDEERDLLGELLNAAHRKNIRVHAWFTVGGDKNYVRLHPETGRFHYKNGHDDSLVSLTDEAYRHYMEQIVREVCFRYPVDGIHLDYIRYNHICYGWSPEDKMRFAAEGADSEKLSRMLEKMYYVDNPDASLLFDAYRSGDPDVQTLARVRRADVVQIADCLTEAARSARSGLMVTAALMPEGAYADTAFADLHYGQNYGDAVGRYDAVLPMAYSQSYGKNGGWLREVAEGTLRHGLSVIMGVQAFAEGTGLTLREDISALSGLPTDGVCLFRDGAYVMAVSAGRKLHIYNAMDGGITWLTVQRGDRSVELEETVLSGAETVFTLPFEVETVRAYQGEREVCVHLTDES